MTTKSLADPIVPARGRLFTAGQAAQYLGVSVSKIRQLVRRHELACVRTPKGRLEGIYEHDCDAWIEQRRHPATPPPTSPPDASRLTRQMAVDAAMQRLMPSKRRFG